MADDLRRYLRDEPIRARRASLVQRGRKWLRRHPSIVGSAVVLLILLTAGSLVAAWLIQAELDETRKRVQRVLGDLAVLQGAGQFALLKEPAVHDALGLTPEQRDELKAVVRRLQEQHQQTTRKFHLLTAAERERGQLNRLRQIGLQVQGAAALRDSQIAQTLKLDARQKAELRTIEDKYWLGPPKGPPHKKGPPGMWDRQLQQRRRIAEEIRNVLTPEQVKQWRALIGEPYTGPAPPMPQRFHPPGFWGGPPKGPKKG